MPFINHILSDPLEMCVESVIAFITCWRYWLQVILALECGLLSILTTRDIMFNFDGEQLEVTVFRGGCPNHTTALHL